MYFSNYHSHNTFCDGRSSMEDFVKFAIAHHIRKYGFSSHAPLPFLTNWTMVADDYPDYEKEFYRLKEKYQAEIELFLGLEIDFVLNCSDAGNAFFRDKKLDYAIGSIHYLDKIAENKYWSIDGPFAEFHAGLNLFCEGDIRQACRRFFEVTNLMMEKGGFDIVGHFDKICFHARKYKDFKVTDKWFRDLVITSLEIIKKKNFILEINTKSLPEHGITFPDISFYDIINELQIPVHVNSDCHYPTNVSVGFSETFLNLKAAGFKTMQQLHNGQWIPVEFDESGLIG